MDLSLDKKTGYIFVFGGVLLSLLYLSYSYRAVPIEGNTIETILFFFNNPHDIKTTYLTRGFVILFLSIFFGYVIKRGYPPFLWEK